MRYYRKPHRYASLGAQFKSEDPAYRRMTPYGGSVFMPPPYEYYPLGSWTGDNGNGNGKTAPAPAPAPAQAAPSAPPITKEQQAAMASQAQKDAMSAATAAAQQTVLNQQAATEQMTMPTAAGPHPATPLFLPVEPEIYQEAMLPEYEPQLSVEEQRMEQALLQRQSPPKQAAPQRPPATTPIQPTPRPAMTSTRVIVPQPPPHTNVLLIGALLVGGGILAYMLLKD